MDFVWDSGKSERNLSARGFDFEFASQVFADRYVEFDDTRHDYGERRLVALGVADGVPLTVVFTDRADARGVQRRIISARLSNRRERRRYAEILEASSQQDDAAE